MRPATKDEIAAFARFELREKIFELRVRQNEHRQAQVRIAGMFAVEQKITVPPALVTSIKEADSILDRNRSRAIQWNKILSAVHAETLGLRFPSGPKSDFQIVGPASMTAEEQQDYELGIVVALTMGVVLVASVLWTLDQHEAENKRCHERYEAVKTVANDKFCAEPESDLCSLWMEFRREQGYENHDTEIIKYGNEIGEILDSVSESMSTGLSVAIPVVLGILAIGFLAKEK